MSERDPALKPLRLLLVDDHQLFREGLQALLATQPDLEFVGEAANVREALALVETTEHDLMVVDIALPGSNGIALLHELRRRRYAQPVLILTMHSQRDMIMEAFEAGAIGYALKNQGVSELLVAVRATARRQRYVTPSLASTITTFEDVPRRPHATQDGVFGVLSAREREVFDLLVRGYSNIDAAHELFVSSKTVETHRCRIYRKLEVHSVGDLIRLAARHGLLTAA